MKNKIENSFFHDLFKVLKNLEYIKSANIVGSILNKNLDEISDLDLVVIIDKLSVDKLQEIEDIILSFNYSNYGNEFLLDRSSDLSLALLLLLN